LLCREPRHRDPRPRRHRDGGRRRDPARRRLRVSAVADLVIVADDGPVRTVRMNRPDKKNALTVSMYETMGAAIEGAAGASAIRCVVIAGAPGAFCAGN